MLASTVACSPTYQNLHLTYIKSHTLRYPLKSGRLLTCIERESGWSNIHPNLSNPYILNRFQCKQWHELNFLRGCLFIILGFSPNWCASKHSPRFRRGFGLILDLLLSVLKETRGWISWVQIQVVRITNEKIGTNFFSYLPWSWVL